MMMNAIPKLMTAVAAAAFLSISPVTAQVDPAPGANPPNVAPPEISRYEIEERVSPEIRFNIGEAFRAPGVAALAPTPVEIDPTVGAVVPPTAQIHGVPPEIVAVSPDVAGYNYVTLADGRTALVDPETNTIVMILD
jgi:hypothetical protein